MKIQLDRTQKIAFARIISDLIEADFIVEESEMDFFEDIISKEGVNISEPMLVEAKKMDLAKAVDILKELDAERRAQIIRCLRELSLSDGTCVPLEAIQIFAVEQAMEHDAQVFSVPSRDIGIDNMKVIYIENEEDTAVAREIETHYRSIQYEFSLAGFDFVHVPFVVDDYKRMRLDYLRKVVRYMIPSVPAQKVDTICHDLRSMTTARFCRDLLYRKINIPLLDANPSLLIKIGESAIIDQYDQEDAARTNYANFLRIELHGEVMEDIHRLIGAYCEIIGQPTPNHPLPSSPKFMYCGFHRSLFDLIAYGREQKDYILFIDLTSHQPNVFFEPMDGTGERIPVKLNPQETALYVMIVRKSFSGKGLDWREQMPTRQKQELLDEYNAIYSRIGKGNTTHEYKDRTQVHHIKNRIRAISCVANRDLFIPEHVRDGHYSYYMVRGRSDQIKIME